MSDICHNGYCRETNSKCEWPSDGISSAHIANLALDDNTTEAESRNKVTVSTAWSGHCVVWERVSAAEGL
jgi:hypothetical protein